MTQSEKLKEIIEYTYKNGYTIPSFSKGLYYIDGKRSGKTAFTSTCLNGLIFSHSFLKAFFGEEKVDDRFGESQEEYEERIGKLNNWGYHKLRWQYHAQKLILLPEEKRINYLYDYMKGENK